ncbi:MAG: carboxypeptidase-like regulatory domain-containing protein [Acidobacteriota bacterium]|nr:carboxypeptidase-like regulatory domain-containing protein [Acidobacteriota bacterium]
MSLRLTIALVILALSADGEAGQSAAGPPGFKPLPPGTGSISGRVADAQSGEPFANVAISLAALRTVGGSQQTTTDATGFYQFMNLAEHEYHVLAMDSLYLRTCYGATDATQAVCGPVVVGHDQHRTGIDFRLSLAAVLRGRVIDAEGRPVGGATVSAALGPSVSPSIFLGSTAQTKADGTFELLRLPSGDTVLSLDLPVTADRPRAPTVFYPGVAATESAETIRVSGGLVTSGITFRYPKITARSLTARISVPASGATGIKAWLYRVEPRMVRAIALDADGAGTVPGLLEGRYFIAAHAQGDSEPLVAFEVANVLDDTVELGLLLQEPGRITGRIVAEKDGLPPLTDLRVAAEWIDDGEEINPLAADDVEVSADGAFRIDGLFGLRRVQLLGLSPEWRVQSIRQGRNEVPATGITVASGATLDVVITVGRR